MYICRAPKNQTELAQYYQMRWQVLREPWQQALGSERDDLEAQSYHRVIVDDMGKVVGVGRLHKTSQYHAQIRYMAISDELHDQGLGKLLIAELERLAAQAGVKTIELNAREKAVGFYQRLGYINTGYSHTLYGDVSHDKMIKKISSAEQHLTKISSDLQQLWHETIPLSKAMNMNVCYFDQEKLLTNCEPSFNKNLHNTMFAGSIYTMATLTGWAWVYFVLQTQVQQADIVLAKGSIRYIAPLEGIAHAQTSIKLVEGSVAPLVDGENARFNIDVEVCCGDKVAAVFTGSYVAMAKRT